MYSGVPTLWGANYATAIARGTPLVIPPFTTVGEALADPEIVPFQQSYPHNGMQIAPAFSPTLDTRNTKLQCIVVGNGGATSLTGNGGQLSVPEPKPHIGTDAAMYSFLPFVCVPLANDITGTDRARFCLRTVITVAGQLYAAYWGMLLPDPSSSPVLNLRTVTNNPDGSTSVADAGYTATVDNLRLQDPVIQGTNEQIYVSAYFVDAIVFSQADAQRMQDAATLLFGSPYYAFINEVGICTGVAKPVNQQYSTDSTGTLTLINPVGAPIEIVGCQINSFVYATQSAVGSTGFTLNLNTAVSDPLYGRES